MKTQRTNRCPGSGMRVTATGSSAFPEVHCPKCAAYLPPVRKYGEVLMRAHSPRLENR
jgi:hypothetical protein